MVGAINTTHKLTITICGRCTLPTLTKVHKAMGIDQITNTFAAGKHQIIIYDNFGYYTVALARSEHFSRSWPIANYGKALVLSKRLIDLTSDQRDMMITDPQGAMAKLKK